jgi:hypothetical protein
MVLPLLFALGGQFLAANAGLGALGVGLSAAGGNLLGQAAQNGGLKDLDFASAALSGVGAGMTAGVPAGADAAAKEAAKSAASSGGMGGIGDAAKAAMKAPVPTVPTIAPPAPQPDLFGKMFNTDTMWNTASQMGGNYMGNPLAMMAAASGNAAPRQRPNGNSKEEQARLQADWNRAISGAIDHEATNSYQRYGGITGGRAPTPDDVRAFMTSSGVGPYPSILSRGKGFAEGGAVSPVGLGLHATVNDMQQQGRDEEAINQTQEMFDVAVMLVTGKLDKMQSQKAFAMLVQALGEQGAQQYLQQVQQAVSESGGEDGRVVGGAPSAQDNVVAQDAQTGEPIKLASGEAILPTPMVEAAGGGLQGAKNIVEAAANNLPEIQSHARRFGQRAHG